MTKYQKTVQAMLDGFTMSDDGERVCIKNHKEWEHRPEQEAVRQVIFKYVDEVDSDSAYRWTLEMVEAISDVLDSEDAEDHETILESGSIYEYLQPEADSVYTLDLMQWLAKSLHNYTAVASGEYAFMPVDEIVDAITMTQVLLKEQIMLEVANEVLSLNK